MILIADDNEADARLIIEALRENGLQEDCEVVSDGDKIVAYLIAMRRLGKLPRLLMLDINMPKKNGLAVLKEVKENPDLRLIPVVMLTTSDADSDILDSYMLFANSFITKPIDMDRFIKVIGQIYSYWFDVAKLPPVS